MNILVTRPEDDAMPLAAALRARGHEPVLAPLLNISMVAEVSVSIAGVQAVLITSANGARALAHQNVAGLTALPAYAVGDGSARAARQAGFASVHSANGDVDDLAALVIDQLVPADGALLHGAGSKVAGDLGGALGAAGFGYQRAVLYQAEIAQSLPAAVVDGLRSGTIGGATFFSPRTARTFATLMVSAQMTTQLHNVTAFCLSSAVAKNFENLAFRAVRVAPLPTQNALLEMIDNVNMK